MTPEPLRILSPGYGLWIYPMMFNARIVIGPIGSDMVDGGWCYHTIEAATEAALAWDPEASPCPRGWHKEVHTGRRWQFVDDPSLPCTYCVQWEPWEDGNPLGPDGAIVHEIAERVHEACALNLEEMERSRG